MYEGLTVGYVLALTQFVMTWVLGWLYLRKADRVFDPLAKRAAEAALAARARAHMATVAPASAGARAGARFVPAARGEAAVGVARKEVLR